MEYLTVKEAALKWEISERRILVLCNEGRIEGAVRFGWSWALPAESEKPDDARLKDNKKKILKGDKQ